MQYRLLLSKFSSLHAQQHGQQHPSCEQLISSHILNRSFDEKRILTCMNHRDTVTQNESDHLSRQSTRKSTSSIYHTTQFRIRIRGKHLIFNLRKVSPLERRAISLQIRCSRTTFAFHRSWKCLAFGNHLDLL